MVRYPVTVALPDGQVATRLLVVLSPDQLCSAMLDKIKSRYRTDMPITLHLNSADGPILDAEDSLGDTITEASDAIFAVLGASEAAFPMLQGASESLALHTWQPDCASLKVRVITPELARSHPNTSDIPLMAGTVTMATTLKQLRHHIEQHLGCANETQINSGDDPSILCNCSFARLIDSRTNFQDDRMIDNSALNVVVVVHKLNQVTTLPILEPTLESIERAVQKHFPTDAAQHATFVIGGIQEPQSISSTTRFLKLPVVALCASISHSIKAKTFHDDSVGPDTPHSVAPSSRKIVVDMHTSEMPIHITAHNQGISLQSAHLDDMTIDGVLNIYAVKRSASDSAEDLTGKAEGKDKIFRQNSAWEHPLGQSERGLANLLSSLRVFTHRIHPQEMEEQEQDAVLHMIMLLTQFPPAVRAFKVLMRGETLVYAERASIVQCFYEVLKDVVPSRVIKNDPTRLLEGSRLLFGLILEKAKHLKVLMRKKDDENSPYTTSFSVHELRNLITMQPVVNPVLISSGLVDRGFFEAFKAGGPLIWSNEDEEPLTIEKPLIRACLLSGGVNKQALSFDMGASVEKLFYTDGGDVTKVITSAELSDLQYLSGLCDRNKLGVIQPSALPSADPPVLTLDRKGLLAVYTGRKACGQAGHDIEMFRPTSDVIVEAVDVSIITQLLIPILVQYAADGTGVFESFGDQNRQVKAPDEIIMICVDASASMDDRCGFVDVEENENVETLPNDENNAVTGSDSQSDTENLLFDRPALDELKEYLAEHDSFQDMLSITQSGIGESHRAMNAVQALEILRLLLSRQISADEKKLARMSRRYSRRQIMQNAERDLAILKNRRIGLTRYEDALVAFLVYRAESTTTDQVLTWSAGDEIPKVAKRHSLEMDINFDIPTDYLCPISSELMENPVSTVDRFTYERKNIERWLQSHNTSPCTNLVLGDMELRPNYQLKRSITSWKTGEDIYLRFSGTYEEAMSILLQSPLDVYASKVPRNITLKDLYHLAFRVTKGRYTAFSLQHQNSILIPTEQLAREYIVGSSLVSIVPIQQNYVRATSSEEHEDLCLIKVYTSYHKMAFSYWETKSNSKTLASIVFRYYRYFAGTHHHLNVKAPSSIWSDMMHQGDGKYRARLHDHCENLSRFLSSANAKGRLIDEPLFGQESDKHWTLPGNEARSQNEPLVFKVLISDQEKASSRPQLSRLDVLKQMFGAFVNRILAYGYQTHMGLVTFRSEASLTQEITHAIENFRHQLNNVTASGDTALWDALSLAQDSLVHYGARYPNAKLRIICLSDGEDTKSKQTAHDIAAALVDNNITVDSFCLGREQMDNLFGISYLTGGYKFQPDELEHAMAICELEPVLSVLERPDITLPNFLPRFNHLIRLRKAVGNAKVNVVDRDTFPLRKEHPLLSESYIELGGFAHTGTNGFNIATRRDTNMRLSRIHNEIRNSAAKGHPHYDVYVCESNMAMWKIVMQGPPGSAYASGTFLLYLEMGEDYPMFPPKGRFITPIYHPNINRHGRICHSIFDRNWTVDTSNKDVIDTIYSLLLVPEFSDPINTVVTLNFHWDEVQFVVEAERHIQKHASKDRAEWKRKIVET